MKNDTKIMMSHICAQDNFSKSTDDLISGRHQAWQYIICYSVDLVSKWWFLLWQRLDKYVIWNKFHNPSEH